MNLPHVDISMDFWNEINIFISYFGSLQNSLIMNAQNKAFDERPKQSFWKDCICNFYCYRLR